jgi:periplasmic protein TonB
MSSLIASLIFLAGAGAFSLPFDLEIGPPPQLPPLARYEPPSFPESLRLTSIADGYATMLFTIDDDGRVIDSIATEASHPAFEKAMQETFAKWRFEPAANNTTPRRELIQFDFRRSGVVSSLSQRDASKSFFPVAPAESERPIRTIDWSDLPNPPQRVAGEMPAYPQSLRAQGIQGVALLSFIVDTQGRVRVPVSLNASDARFARAALAAVKHWRFTPAELASEPVNLRVERTFNFGARKGP